MVWCIKYSFPWFIRQIIDIIKKRPIRIKNVKTRKDPTDNISVIVFNVKNTGIAIDETIQVLLIYKYMDGHFKRDLFRPSIFSMVVVLLEKLRHQKKIWFDIYGN